MFWEQLSQINKPFFALAPMIDVTDSAFRQLVSRCAAPDVFFSEFVCVDAIQNKRKTKENKLVFSENEKSLVVQLWGNTPELYEQQSQQLSQSGFVGIDINMGCPVDKVISRGSCSALMNNRSLATEIIKATQYGATQNDESFPVSVKTRIGFDEIDLSWIEFLLEHNLSCLTIHTRTVVEQSKVPAHFEVLEQIVALRDEISPSTKIVANGDIKTRLQGEQLAKQYGLDGIMIGRGIFSDPYVFAKQSPWQDMTPQEKLQLFIDHCTIFDQMWGRTKNPEILKKFAKVYVSGFDGAAAIRERIMGLRSVEDIKRYLGNNVNY